METKTSIDKLNDDLLELTKLSTYRREERPRVWPLIVRPLLLVGIIALTAATSFAISPTDAEKTFYKAMKDRFISKPEFGKPDAADSKDKRIDVNEFLSTEGTPKLIASKVCPAGSSVDRVEIHASFELVHWEDGGEAAGAIKLIEVKQELKDKVKKLIYRFGVMFNSESGSAAESNDFGKWNNAGLFYHEMLHGQLTYNRMKDPNWAGWAQACKCDKPNPNFIAKGVKAEEQEHLTIGPAQETYLIAALRAQANMSVSVFTTTGISGEKDGDGNRAFTKEIELPANLAEKEELGITIIVKENVEGEPTVKVKDQTVTITGKVKDDKTARLVVLLDPPGIGFLVHLTVLPPAPPFDSESPSANLEDKLAKFWWLYLAAFVVTFILLMLRRK